ncbi:MAG: transglutaminase-like cysteine peptidase [Alphaproteobacteria bacterium]|nr:transglutaminase-like cysteine peptidase [Alphaproteobacteria bacterium]
MGKTEKETKESGGVLTALKKSLSRNKLGELLVIHGIITSEELLTALHQQKKNNRPLGQILIENKLISKYQLAAVLGRQYVIRTLAAGVFFMASMGASMGKSARADMIKDVPAQISLTSTANSAFGKMNSYPALFDTAEKRSGSLKAFTKWTGMFDRFERELRKSENQDIVREWQNDLAGFQGLELKKMASKVNSLMNEKQYIVDSKNWGQSDYWATPIEFMKRGGDCEDFAIAKYTALRSLGVPEERMRIAIVHDKQKNIPHAILIVYTDEGPYILDNQNKNLVSGSGVGRYRPIFSINRTAWWLHQAPTTTIVASAQ